MIHRFALLLFLGRPLLMYAGILSFLLLLMTATIGFLNYKGNHKIPFKWHPVLAALTILAVLFHAILGLSVQFGF